MTGIILKGRYCIISRIGKGGEGTLYLARDLELGIYRAVKELPLSRKREAGLLRLLKHPSLPGMIDYIEQGENCYLVMEYIQGKSLEQYLEEGRRFSPEEIIRIGIRILQILSYLHSRKPAVYYGDLKPGNLMLTEEDELYLVDFGSAVCGYDRQHGVCMGTKGYAAPEQFQGKICGESDFYGLGKTLGSLCGKGKVRIYLRYPGLWLFIRKCCRIQPEKRWKNTRDAQSALSGIHPLPLKMRNFMIPLTIILVLLLLPVTGVSRKEAVHLPPFYSALSPVTAWSYSMPCRSGSPGLREEIFLSVERSLKRLMNQYTEKDQQRKLWMLLAVNSELRGDMAKAEGYYGELRISGEPEDIAAYGLFLLRRGRLEESRKLFKDNLNTAEDCLGSGYYFYIWKQTLKRNGRNVQ